MSKQINSKKLFKSDLSIDKEVIDKDSFQFSKQSFDRFGDDLCELLLSYLSLESKVCFQCVSKQWKSLIFNKQQKLLISETEKGENSLVYRKDNWIKSTLNYVLKKCKFIKEIKIEFCGKIDGEILEIIVNKCLHLNKLFLRQTIFQDISSQHLIKFGQKIGVNLSELTFHGIIWKRDEKLLPIEAINELMDSFLRFTPNLKSFKYYSDPYLFSWHNIIKLLSSDNYSLHKLVEINIFYGINYESIKQFTNKYFKQIKTIKLSLNTKDFSNNDLNKSLIEMSRFENIETLHLTLKLNQNNKSIDSYIDCGLIMISEKCLKLKCLQLIMFGNLIKGKLFETLGHFRELKVCKIKIVEPNHENQTQSHDSIECFKNVGNLTKLDLMLSYLTDDHLKDIHLYLPNLTSIKISSDKTLTDKSLLFLSQMPHLSHIEINAFNFVMFDITDSGVCHLINNCFNIKTISFKCNTKLTEKSIYAFIEIAKNKPKTECKFSYVSTSSSRALISLDSIEKPNNLLLDDMTSQFFSKYNIF